MLNGLPNLAIDENSIHVCFSPCSFSPRSDFGDILGRTRASIKTVLALGSTGEREELDTVDDAPAHLVNRIADLAHPLE